MGYPQHSWMVDGKSRLVDDDIMGYPYDSGNPHIYIWKNMEKMNLWDEGKKHLAARLGMNMTISIREWDECGDLAMQVTHFLGGGTQSKMCHEFEVIF